VLSPVQHALLDTFGIPVTALVLDVLQEKVQLLEAPPSHTLDLLPTVVHALFQVVLLLAQHAVLDTFGIPPALLVLDVLQEKVQLLEVLQPHTLELLPTAVHALFQVALLLAQHALLDTFGIPPTLLAPVVPQEKVPPLEVLQPHTLDLMLTAPNAQFHQQLFHALDATLDISSTSTVHAELELELMPTANIMLTQSIVFNVLPETPFSQTPALHAHQTATFVTSPERSAQSAVLDTNYPPPQPEHAFQMVPTSSCQDSLSSVSFSITSSKSKKTKRGLYENIYIDDSFILIFFLLYLTSLYTQ
jgi:hypothetical protein